MVTLGFIDLHTHLDAQIGGDPDLTPVSWRGATSALMGNCGVTSAPAAYRVMRTNTAISKCNCKTR